MHLKPTSPGRRGRGRPRDFDTKVALEKALALFWGKGYASTSISELTAAMGITAPSLYSAFGSKESLFRAAITLYMAEYVVDVGQTLNSNASARDALMYTLGELAKSFTSRKTALGCFVIFNRANAAATTPAIRQELNAQLSLFETAFSKHFSKAKSELPPGADPHKLTQFYMTVISGMSTQARLGASLKQLEGSIAFAMRAWPHPR